MRADGRSEDAATQPGRQVVVEGRCQRGHLETDQFIVHETQSTEVVTVRGIPAREFAEALRQVDRQRIRGIRISRGCQSCSQHSHARGAVDSSHLDIISIVRRNPDRAAAPIRRRATRANPYLIISRKAQPVIGLKDNRRIHRARIGIVSGRRSAGRLLRIKRWRGRAPGKIFRVNLQLAGIALADGGDSNRLLVVAEFGNGDGHQVHGLEQVELPAELQRVSRADLDLALAQQVGHELCHPGRGDMVRLFGLGLPQTIDSDRGFVFVFRHLDVVIVGAVHELN